jgi:amidase
MPRNDFETAADIADDVRRGRRSAVDVITASLARIARLDPDIEAFQAVAAAAAREAAEVVDARPDRSQLALAGVPVAIKDNIDVLGMPTRHGSPATTHEPADADDELVRRLRAAGAVVVGKTKLPELAIWPFTESAAFGGTRNPEDPARNAGGSTGGAAAVAAGMVPIAVGTDGGGSVRIPAANCGVVAIKPAPGVIPLPGGEADHWYGCTVVGTVAMSVEDALLALDTLAGRSRTVPHDRPGLLRIAASSRSPVPVAGADALSKPALSIATDAARSVGHFVSRAHPPYPASLINRWCEHWLAGVAADAERLGLDVAMTERRTQTVIDKGRALARRDRPDVRFAAQWRERALGWFEQYDAFITPTVARPAPLAGAAASESYLRSYLRAARGTPFTQPWNLAGLPAVNVPVPAAGGRGVQVVAATEGVAIRVARELEEALGAARQPSADLPGRLAGQQHP